MTDRIPALRVWAAKGPVRAVALVLHGGAEAGLAQVRPWGLAYLRMLPLARAISAAAARHGVEVRLLRNRVRGWNEPGLHPVADARWALARIHEERPGAPVFLVGHSMGGRVALRVADDPAVTAVCALAPWTPRGEPVEPVKERSVLIAHGTLDHVTNPAESYAYAERARLVAARLVRFELMSEAHAMLLRAPAWNRLVRGFTLDAAGAATLPAWKKAPDQRLRLPL
ncbi:alpha/beta fold hydrolase [Amycolatopsis acidiphila]|uniref:Alpha/beta fold hydrolase n=1 Tax=Amycolatopsis acidiphila TaxID=715473 RepID=A0A558A1E4_9PSEU|nr:alpha/beta hydrolase [Amycolatopsis acidiphila]TVT18074.1 alpha/beta fold hydrolase [Amycolatopsis acidiphila]UIJ56646.1 alpha/beta fold hydrolase [Amycolatopsis acidiphila]